MDKVRLGRALGKGARSLWEAADAATAKDPRAGAAKPTGAAATVGRSGVVRQGVESVVQAQRVVAATRQQTRRAGFAAVAPVIANAKRLSGVLWLEVTGCFFALFALFLGGAVWKSRGAVRAGWQSAEAHRLGLYVVVFAAFAYFAVSSFVRAKRRGRS